MVSALPLVAAASGAVLAAVFLAARFAAAFLVAALRLAAASDHRHDRVQARSGDRRAASTACPTRRIRSHWVDSTGSLLDPHELTDARRSK